jgi:hypothetical protein
VPDAADPKRLVHRRGPDGRMEVGPDWESLIERQIREAMEEGAFDALPHQGEPLPLEDDSGAGDWAMAHRMLRDAGMAPPWIEADKEVRALLGRRDALLERAPRVAPAGRARIRTELTTSSPMRIRRSHGSTPRRRPRRVIAGCSTRIGSWRGSTKRSGATTRQGRAARRTADPSRRLRPSVEAPGVAADRAGGDAADGLDLQEAGTPVRAAIGPGRGARASAQPPHRSRSTGEGRGGGSGHHVGYSSLLSGAPEAVWASAAAVAWLVPDGRPYGPER